MTIELAKLQPLMLDWLGPDYVTKAEYALRGDDVPWLPFFLSLCFFLSAGYPGWFPQ